MWIVYVWECLCLKDLTILTLPPRYPAGDYRQKGASLRYTVYTGLLWQMKHVYSSNLNIYKFIIKA